MSYADVVAMVADWDLRMRIVACAAAEQDEGALAFVEDNIWRICSSEGWDAAWAKAVADGTDDPGEHETVISDAAIKSAVLDVVHRNEAKSRLAEAEAEHVRTLRLDAEQERQFRIHTRMREWDNEHPPQVQATLSHPEDEEA
jgi:hypothetical protein